MDSYDGVSVKTDIGKPFVDDLTEYLPFACLKFGIQVYCERTMVQEEYSAEYGKGAKKGTNGKSKGKFNTVASQVRSMPSMTDTYNTKITVRYTGDMITHLIFTKGTTEKAIAWEILRVLSFIIQFYPHLTSISINSGSVDYCLPELGKVMKMGNLTEICLDDTYVTARKYSKLLEDAQNLQILSLSRCRLGDDEMLEIIEQMKESKPGSYNLCALNVSTNELTDVSALSLAKILRYNRKLEYINLTGNKITTVGGLALLDVLCKFQMTIEEFKAYQINYIRYLRDRQMLIDTYLKTAPVLKPTTANKKIEKNEKNELQKKTSRKLFPENDERERFATEHAERVLGEYDHAFHVPLEEDGNYYCLGNNALAYLCVAYNNITQPFLTKLVEVIQHQRTSFFLKRQKGLVNIKLEGNPLPSSTQELKDIDLALQVGLSTLRGRKSIAKPLRRP